jgi:hypothetical protein
MAQRFGKAVDWTKGGVRHVWLHSDGYTGRTGAPASVSARRASARLTSPKWKIEAAREIPIEIGVTHAGSGAGVCAPGTLQHLALKADTETDLIALRDRIRSRGVNVIGPILHGMCRSIYFAGPEQLTLEIATSDAPIDADLWIDPSVAEKVGITAEELAAYRAPARYAGEGGQVKQPPYDPSRPHQTYPDALYAQLLKTPDEVITAQASYDKPPVVA